ncbi:MAG: SUMF1/EgtB/PvdO family nonheme iron enzyme [Candidatus Electrothrix aestuarii]|uniref:SUMF1/EgtB/PvdO family nonheme iron enzyme n=1 Tax=Candidatus Electrothrix aestuarii TaxID=3062594 RepID=A0AAU8LZI7_9BACT
MRFHAVYLGLTGTPDCRFASREIELGSYENTPNYKKQPGRATISGGFFGKRNGQSDCLYYLGETEVQRSQWHSIMQWPDRREQSLLSPVDKTKYPKTEITYAEVFQFIESLNSWILQRQEGELPTFGYAKAHCRLPTEAEWVFAAQEGIKNKYFNCWNPYGGKQHLGKYEWYKGNSGGKINQCGQLKPNKIGLKDMLGNVEELTISLFSPEYQRGRFGQFVICGNNYSDASEDFTVLHRTEFASHTENGKLRRPKNVGFRLVLTTSVSASIGGDILNADGDYQQDRNPSVILEKVYGVKIQGEKDDSDR